MKLKMILKIAVDLCMTLGLLFLMGYQFWGEAAHEWVGAGMFLLFILHHILNGNWYKGLFHGRYTPARIVWLVIDLLVFLSMIGLMVSGIMLSNHAFAWLHIRGGKGFARLLHMAASHWGFVLMALHLGMHWGMFMGIARKALARKNPSRLCRMLLLLLGDAVAIHGLIAFIRRDLLTYMFLRTRFVFLDFSEPIPLFYLDYVAMMGTFIFLAYHVFRFLQKVRRGSRTQRP